MKRSTISKYDQFKERLTGYVALLNYRYMNLCVKAEEAALLPVNIVIEGESKRIEDVCNIARKDDFSLMVFPKYEEDLMQIELGIKKSHPEFKQERQTMTLEMDDGQNMDLEYILLTMPEVDDNRYDVLKQAVNMLYDECKAEMEKAKKETEGEIAALSANEKKEDIDKLKDAVEKVDKTFTEKRDKVHEDKLKEIEEGHQNYLQEQTTAEQKRLEDEQAQGDGGKSIDMSLFQK